MSLSKKALTRKCQTLYRGLCIIGPAVIMQLATQWLPLDALPSFA
jgi:hypothetical protein